LALDAYWFAFNAKMRMKNLIYGFAKAFLQSFENDEFTVIFDNHIYVLQAIGL
jgi:hypothetical protein